MLFKKRTNYAEESTHYDCFFFLQQNALFSRLQTRIAYFARGQKA